MEQSVLGGKENDLRIHGWWILYVEHPECNFGFQIAPEHSHFTDEDWIKKYPEAYAIYKIWGISPQSYVTKTKIKG